MQDLKKMMKELTMTVADMKAQSTSSSSHSMRTTSIAGGDTSHLRNVVPAGGIGGDKSNGTEFFDMYDTKTEEKDDQTSSENSKMLEKLDLLVLKGRENPEANSVQFASFPTSAQLQVWKTGSSTR